jgi:ABC-type Na+ transport system ATPase subunit NatA
MLSGVLAANGAGLATLLQVKYEMLRQVHVDKRAVSRTAKEFGFSRPSFYQAEFAFEQGGFSGLLPQKRGPRSSWPNGKPWSHH